MRKTVKEATPEEMFEMEDFAYGILETLNANQQLDMLNDLAPKYGLDPQSVVQIGLGLPDWAKLNSDLFSDLLRELLELFHIYHSPLVKS